MATSDPTTRVPEFEFQFTGKGRYLDLEIVHPCGCGVKNCPFRWPIVIPYEVWSGELWALLAGELDRQGRKRG